MPNPGTILMYSAALLPDLGEILQFLGFERKRLFARVGHGKGYVLGIHLNGFTRRAHLELNIDIALSPPPRLISLALYWRKLPASTVSS